ncbi:Hypothetical protein CINCED_3A020590 [Cinara cedri]|uniref:Uncharacterized protein n=1 Tax=Cinara cedri TaxID=506608 RepID=A0A5E4M3N7_9HEMI|nr:Hypothetical protein CINCED_3A020590 [Cinara cedri]
MIKRENGTSLTENVKIVDEFEKIFKVLLKQSCGSTIIEERIPVEQNIEPPPANPFNWLH